MCVCGCYMCVVSWFEVVNMRPCVFVGVICAWSHDMKLSTWDHVCLWVLYVRGLMVWGIQHETMRVCGCCRCMVSWCEVVNMRPCVFVGVVGAWSHGMRLSTWDHVCLWVLYARGLMVWGCQHETMCVCEYYMCVVSWYEVVNMRPGVCGCYRCVVSWYEVVNMRPCVFVGVIGAWSHGLRLSTWDHVCLWVL
jgi:hypothetical protein